MTKANIQYQDTISNLKVSRYNRADDVKNQSVTSIGNELNRIRQGYTRATCERLRALSLPADKDKYDTIKIDLPNVTFSGTFLHRKNASVISTTNIICADFDHLEDAATYRNELREHPHIYSAWISPGGQGVKALIITPTFGTDEELKKIFVRLQLVHPEIDNSCKDISRACFTSYDPDLWVNPNATIVDLPEPIEMMVAKTNELKQQSSWIGKGAPEDYILRGDHRAELESRNWTYLRQSGEWEQYSRPGKTKNISGSWHIANKFFYCHSSTIEQTKIEAKKPYSLFQLYCIWSYGDDSKDSRSKAAKDLYAANYGDKQPKYEMKSVNDAVKKELATPPPHEQKVKGDHNESEELLLSYVPKFTKHIIALDGHGILRPGMVAALVGPAGFGKSAVTESGIASYINPYGNTLGLRVEKLERPLLWIDGERTKDDLALCFTRIKKRILSENNPDLIENNRFKNVYCHPFITYSNRESRRKELARLVELHNPALVILDGFADFVRDVNDTAESIDFIDLLTSLANTHDFGVFGSIHPNPGKQADHKPRGVLGSELIRTCESVLLLKRAPDDRDIRILTTHFDHGKNRSENDSLETYFRWDTKEKMFVSCDYTQKVKSSKADSQDQAFDAILATGGLNYESIVNALIEKGFCKSAPTAKRWIGEAASQQRGLIIKEAGMYRLNGHTPF